MVVDRSVAKNSAVFNCGLQLVVAVALKGRSVTGCHDVDGGCAITTEEADCVADISGRGQD